MFKHFEEDWLIFEMEEECKYFCNMSCTGLHFYIKIEKKMYHTIFKNILLHLCTINNKPCIYEEYEDYDVTLIFRHLAIL